MTAEQLLYMPSNDQYHELVRGELFTKPPGDFLHGRVAGRLCGLIGNFPNFGRYAMFANAGFVLARDPDTVRGADFALMRRDKIARNQSKEGFIEGAPELAVEVICAWDNTYAMEDKIDEFFEAGTKLFWLVNPKRETVIVYRPSVAPELFSGDQYLDGEEVIPGFKMQVSQVFASPF